MTIAEKIKYLRKQIGITQDNLGNKSNIHPVSIRKYETNKMKPQQDQIEKLANALNVSPFALADTYSSYKIQTLGDLYGAIIYLYKSNFIDFIISPTSNNIDIKFNDLIVPLLDLKNHETGETEIVNQNFYTISLIQKLKEKSSYDKFYKLATDYAKLKNAEENHIIDMEKLSEEIGILELELQQSTELLKNL